MFGTMIVAGTLFLLLHNFVLKPLVGHLEDLVLGES